MSNENKWYADLWIITLIPDLKPGSDITVMVPAVPALVSKAEYDYGTCVLSPVPQAEFNLVCGTAGTVQWVFAEVEFFIVRFQNGCKKARNKHFLPMFSSWLSKTRPKKNQVESKHKLWISEIIRQRPQNGQFHRLFVELRFHNREYFYR